VKGREIKGVRGSSIAVGDVDGLMRVNPRYSDTRLEPEAVAALREACDEFLAEHPPAQPTLDTQDPEPGTLIPDTAHARRSDPSTSHAAAASLTEETLRASQEAVLRFLRVYGPMTDEELVDRYQVGGAPPDRERYPAQSPSGIRSRRAELAGANPPLVIDTGRRRETKSGRQAIIWRARGPLDALFERTD
jgi:hypothetical protein